MSWCALDIRSHTESRTAIVLWMVGRTGQAVEEREDGLLVGFAQSEATARVLLDELRQRFGSAVTALSRVLPEVDWTERWRDGLGPRRVGRLTISPSWTAPEVPDAPTVIIDPETAFGTGEHGSTRTALVLLDRYLLPGNRVLDLGSGSGIIAIAAVKLGAARAVAVEIDDEAEPIARANAVRNGVAGKVAFFTGDAATLAPLLGPVEVVVSNILRSVNVALIPAIRASLAPGGVAIFTGMEQPERELFLPVLQAEGFTPVDEVVDDTWWGVAALVG
jgi:ribosomal protein L11 methyltransferase